MRNLIQSCCISNSGKGIRWNDPAAGLIVMSRLRASVNDMHRLDADKNSTDPAPRYRIGNEKSLVSLFRQAVVFAQNKGGRGHEIADLLTEFTVSIGEEKLAEIDRIYSIGLRKFAAIPWTKKPSSIKIVTQMRKLVIVMQKEAGKVGSKYRLSDERSLHQLFGDAGKFAEGNCDRSNKITDLLNDFFGGEGEDRINAIEDQFSVNLYAIR